MDDLEIIVTSDGSHTLRNSRLNETYHSIHGAIRESIHVFLTNGLLFFQEHHHPSDLEILEVGFGTGLNALLTATHSIANGVSIRYTSLEPEPISEETFQKLNYPVIVDRQQGDMIFRKLHTARWDGWEEITDMFVLNKRRTRLEEFDMVPSSFDVIYFDAFAPAKQPGLWDLSVLRIVERLMKPGAVFVTYCAKGQVKRDLRSLGLRVETLPGPPGKKEMVRAIKS